MVDNELTFNEIIWKRLSTTCGERNEGTMREDEQNFSKDSLYELRNAPV